MANVKKELNDSTLEKVVGGFFKWNTNTGYLTYYHEDGSETKHKILNAEEGWALSNTLHAQHMPEDDILARLIAEHYLEG